MLRQSQTDRKNPDMTDAKPDVLVMCAPRPSAMSRLEAGYTLHRYDQAENKAALVAEVGPRCRAVATIGSVKIGADVLASLPALGLVACQSAGYDGIDVGALRAAGVTLCTASLALEDDVADMAMLLLLATRRDLVRAHRHVQSGDWATKGEWPLQSSLAGKKVGIVGMGHVGQAIARRCGPFGVELAYFGRRAKPGVAERFEPDLVALATWADVLILAIAGGPATEGLISTPVLDALGPQGVLVTVARGSVVDEPALIAALREGRLGRAGLDVFASEPDPDPALTSLPNVTLTPHAASATEETRERMSHLVIDNIDASFAGQPLLSPLEP